MSDGWDAPEREHLFKSVYEAVYPDLLRFVQRRASRDHAEDVVTEAFLVVWRRLDELPHAQDRARAWIFAIARNILLNDKRGERRRRALGIRLATVTTSSPAHADSDGVMSRIALAGAWRHLSEAQQEALALAVFEDLDARQAAALVGISHVAFRLRLSRARRALRLHLNHSPIKAATPTHHVSERTIAP